MEKKMKVAVMVCVVAVAVVVREGSASTAQGPALAPSAPDCSNLILSLADCLSFVTNGSTVRKPEGKCCPSLKSVLKTAPSCLCQAFLSSSQFGVVLNVSKALTLPAACKLSAPSFSNCALSQTPAAAPAGSPTSSAGAPALNGPAGEVSPTQAPSPSPGNVASVLKLPFSAGFLSVCLLGVLFSGLIP